MGDPIFLTLRVARVLLLLAAVLSLAWNQAFHWVFGTRYDPPWQRAIIAAAALASFALSYTSWGKKRLATLIHCVLYGLTAHYFFLMYQNAIDPAYQVGAFITITAISVVFDRREALLAYIAMTAVLSLGIAAALPPSPLNWFLPFGLLTVELVNYIVLTQRLRLTSALNQSLAVQRETAIHLARTEKLASIGTMVAGVAHEINNPLAAVTLQVGLLRDEAASEPNASRRHKILSESLLSLERIGQIVRAMKSHTHEESTDAKDELRPVVLGEVVDRLPFLLLGWRKVGAALEIALSAGERAIAVRGQSGWIEQVLLNLIENAYQAYPEGVPKWASLSICYDDDRVRLRVTDRGPGMKPSVLPKIFDPFFTTKPVGEGTGLGLYLSLGLMRRMEGDLSVQSTPGEGTVFELAFLREKSLRETSAAPPPAVQAPLPTRTLVKESAERPAKYRLLLVDDEAELLAVISSVLESRYQVVSAANGKAALAILTQQSGIDLVLTDLTMPQMGGIELYRNISGQLPGLRDRVLFMSGGTLNPESEAFLKEHHDRVLSKPFSIDALLQFLNRHSSTQHKGAA